MANVVIIGGGVSGLSAGIYSLMRGHRVALCERHASAGGNLTGWDRGGCRIDNCIHWLTGTNPATDTFRTWTDIGMLGGVEILQPETLYTCEYGGRSLSLKCDIEALERDMLAISPADEKEIKRLVSAVRTVMEIMGVGGENNDRGVNFLRLIKNLPGLFGYFSESAGKTAERFSHPLLKRFYRALLTDEFSSLAVVIVFATFCGKNGGLPRGGSVAAAERITARFKKLGGELYLGNGAERIIAEGKTARSVILSDGTNLAADYVVIATDPTAAMGKLLDFSLPAKMLRQYKNPLYRRFSAVHCAFSASGTDFKGDLILPAPQFLRTAFGAEDLILREFSHEPDFAPTGRVVLQAFFFCDEDESQRLVSLGEASAAYRAEKARIAMHVRAAIEERFPSLKGDLDLLDVWTPATYRRYTGAEAGAFMSFSVPPFSVLSGANGRIKEYKNVFLATQWLQPPGGLPAAAAAGRKAAALIDESVRREKRISFFAKKRVFRRG